ncbi:GumC family protein [Yoonia litorea]|uniref:Uncharacterized protein involved in exopolysaccharide biosynthesis n=1 Tax=Yoonia litorea TaxID=1123755 RepID=A0A1I6LE92_9RHOB|nr:Wzz/FepE/Etk N-terminal domain-containing protein [Yoonia litorea]SFS01590.1 Uncharacterized protein involved in exopolysaccharide biosynthesis [Yoonia litorea]
MLASQQTTTPASPHDLWRMAYVFWFGKWLILASVIFCSGLGGFYAFYVNEARYAASATLRLNAQPTDLRDVSDHWPPPSTDPFSLNTERAILTADHILEAVVLELALLDDPEFNRYLSRGSNASLRDRVRQLMTGAANPVPDQNGILKKTVRNLRLAIWARHTPDTYLFEITAQSADPVKAARLANAVADAYISAQRTAHDMAMDENINWLNDRVAALRDQLLSQEAVVSDLRGRAQLRDDSALDDLANQILNAHQQEATASDALAHLSTQETLTARQAAERDQLSVRLAVITEETTRLTTQLAAQSAGLASLQQARREADATRVLYETFLGRLQETQVQRGLDAPDARLLAPATIGTFAGTSRVLMLKASAFLGFLVGVLAVIVRHLSRRGILHPAMLKPIFKGNAILFGGQETVFSPDTQSIVNLTHALKVATQGKPTTTTLIVAADHHETMDVALTLAKAYAVHDDTLLVRLDGTQTQTNETDHRLSQINVPTTDLLNAEALARHLKHWQQMSSHVFIDASAAPAEFMSTPLVSKVDASLIVIAWAATPMAMIMDRAKALKHESDAPLLPVLTGVNRRKMRQFSLSYPVTPAPT